MNDDELITIMKYMNDKEKVQYISATLKRLGFKKSGLSWWQTKNDITIILALQKSRFDNHSTFEMGSCIDKSRNHQTLKYYNCGISLRLGDISGSDSRGEMRIYHT